MTFKRKNIPRWTRTSDFVLRKKEPNKIMAILQIDDTLWLNIHTDINVYDFSKKVMWKGDLI